MRGNCQQASTPNGADGQPTAAPTSASTDGDRRVAMAAPLAAEHTTAGEVA